MRKRTTGPKPHFIASDSDKNPEMKAQLGGLRGAILDAAGTPNRRFVSRPDPLSPAMFLARADKPQDQVLVPLFAWGEVVQVVNCLFPEGE